MLGKEGFELVQGAGEQAADDAEEQAEQEQLAHQRSGKGNLIGERHGEFLQSQQARTGTGGEGGYQGGEKGGILQRARREDF